MNQFSKFFLPPNWQANLQCKLVTNFHLTLLYCYTTLRSLKMLPIFLLGLLIFLQSHKYHCRQRHQDFG